MEQDANSTIDWTLSDSVVGQLRLKKCCIEDAENVLCPNGARRLQSDDEVIKKFMDSPDNREFASRRQQRFGTIALKSLVQNDRTGGANWYSVDRNGYVRVHYWYTMGYGRAWGRS